jgi:hypothetical protein
MECKPMERRRLACKACFSTLMGFAVTRRCWFLTFRASRSLQASRLRSIGLLEIGGFVAAEQ